MEQKEIFESLKKPTFYGKNVKSVEMLQTHISFVALTGNYAYKVKKPVNFGFLDFSSLEKRKYFCEEEMKLNKRLCPEIYLDVLPITLKDGNLELNGSGPIVEYTLKMKEFSQEEIMTNLLKKGQVDETHIENICNILNDFYKLNKNNGEIDDFGRVKSIKLNIDENFEQTKSVVDIAIKKDIYTFIQKKSSEFLDRKNDIFEKRIKQGYIQDCHGDLHSGNIVISDKIYIFDCIEFNKRFRFCDVASDLSFLAMDLDYLNYPFLSSYLINFYVKRSKDKEIFDVLNFYKSYRAYVRGKVNCFRLDDSTISESEKEEIINISEKYFDLAYYYSSLFSLDLENNKPIVFMICGLTGTGKSTLAMKLAVDYHAQHINTDVVRKELAGIDKYERHHDNIDTGLYAPDKIGNTYEKVIEKTQNHLRNGENVVLDATFQKKDYRNLVKKIADENKSHLITIKCVSTDELVKKWLNERLKKKSISDGRWEVYLVQKKTFEPLTSEEKAMEFDTSIESYEYRMNFFKKLIEMIRLAL